MVEERIDGTTEQDFNFICDVLEDRLFPLMAIYFGTTEQRFRQMIVSGRRHFQQRGDHAFTIEWNFYQGTASFTCSHGTFSI
jgi:hypothetical protein